MKRIPIAAAQRIADEIAALELAIDVARDWTYAGEMVNKHVEAALRSALARLEAMRWRHDPAAVRLDALEAAAQIADSFTCGACGMDGKTGAAIRALAAVPLPQSPEPQEGER